MRSRRRDAAPANPGRPGSLEDLLEAVSHPIRRELLVRLASRPRAVGELAARMELDDSQVSRILGELWDFGLAAWSIDGRRHLYTLTPQVRMDREGPRLDARDGSGIALRLSPAERRLLLWPEVKPTGTSPIPDVPGRRV